MLPMMLFPAMFYLLFGVLMAKSDGADAARYLLASYSVFGVMSPGLFGFGVSLALERERPADLQARAADAAGRVSAGQDADGDAGRGGHRVAAGAWL